MVWKTDVALREEKRVRRQGNDRREGGKEREGDCQKESDEVGFDSLLPSLRTTLKGPPQHL